jgi:integrase
MGRKPADQTITVMKGVLLKRSPKSPYWQCSCRVGKTTHRKSTGEEDDAQARLKAMEWLMDLRQQATLGISSKRLSFNQLADSYLATILAKTTQDYHRDTIGRHHKPFFGAIADIKQITAGMLSDYIVYRRNKNDNSPTPQTLNREATVLRQMLRYAHMQKWIPDLLNVPHLDESLTAKRRPHFTEDEYTLLLDKARSRIEDATNDKQIQHAVANRHLLYDAIVLLANSGLRVDEMHSLTWRNILWEAEDIQLTRAGKRKSSRKLVLRKSGLNALKRIHGRRIAYLQEAGLGQTLDMDERVISLPDGRFVSDMKTAFRALIRDCGFTYAVDSPRHSLTSLRHTYATFSLTRKFGPRPRMEVLAMQMGTSQRMIQAHYGHNTVDDHRDELRGVIAGR